MASSCVATCSTTTNVPMQVSCENTPEDWRQQPRQWCSGGAKRSKTASTMLYRPEIQVRVVVHGGDITFAGTESERRTMRARVRDWDDVKVPSFLGVAGESSQTDGGRAGARGEWQAPLSTACSLVVLASSLRRLTARVSSQRRRAQEEDTTMRDEAATFNCGRIRRAGHREGRCIRVWRDRGMELGRH